MTLYGLIGWPIGHSLSPKIFADRFRNENIDAEYRLFPLEDANLLPQLIETNPELAGLNVTSPWKEEVMKFMQDLTPEARLVGAVNTIRIDRRENGDVSLTGHNTDAVGFRRQLERLLKGDERSALVAGTGGASKAVCVALGQLGIRHTLVSRKAADGTISYEEVTPEVIVASDIIINATPLGMADKADKAPAFPYTALSPRHLCIDLIYNPAETLFMRLCAKEGARTANGLEMLLGQAEEAWRFWNSGENSPL